MLIIIERCIGVGLLGCACYWILTHNVSGMDRRYRTLKRRKPQSFFVRYVAYDSYFYARFIFGLPLVVLMLLGLALLRLNRQHLEVALVIFLIISVALSIVSELMGKSKSAN